MTTIDTALLTSKSYDLSTTTSNDYEFTSLDGSKVAMDYSIDGNNLVAKASEKVSYILKATVGTAGHVDAGTHEYAVNDVIELKLAKSGDVGAKPNTWMWQSTTAYNVDAQGALLPGETEKHYIYMDLEHGDFTDTTAINAANFGIGGLTFSSIAIYKSVDGADAVALNPSEISAFITNYKAAIYDSEAEEPLSLAERSAVNKKINDLATTPAEYTFVNYAKEGVDATVKVTDKINTNYDLANHNWVVKADDDNEFIGTRLGETANSTKADEVFTMGTGNDTINFKGNFGDDTVDYTLGEKLALTIKNYGGTNVTPVATVIGDDVVLTPDQVTYYATAEVTGSLWGNKVADEKSPKTYTFELAQYHDEQFPVNGLEGKYMWKATEKYADVTTGTGKEAKTLPRYWMLDNSLFNITAGTDGTYTITEGGATAKNFKVYKVVNGVKTDITDAYVAAAKDVSSQTGESYVDTPASSLYNEQVTGSITISGMAKYDIADKLLKVNNVELEDLVFTPSVDKKGTTFTGSRFNDDVESTEEKETFDLKTGFNKVRFSGDFGDDTVKLTAHENLNLAFDFNNTLGSVEDVRDVLSYSTKGKDLVISADNSYKLTATFTPGSYDNINYTAGTYQFELKQVKSESDAVNGGYAWICTGKLNKDGSVDTTQVVAREATAAEKALGYETVSMILDKSDFAGDSSTAGGVTISGIKVTQTINGKEHDVTSAYKTVVTAGTDAQYKTFNSGLFNDQLSGSITVKNYAGKETDAYVSIADNTNPWLSIDMTIQAKGNKFTGTVLDDTAVSTSANETFDLKTALMGDEIQFSGNFGKDTVKMNADENLDLNITFNDTLNLGQTWQDVANMTVNGSKLELTADNSYKLTATFTAGKYDNIDYTAGTYQFELKQVKSESDAVNGGYAWICTGKLNKDGSVDTTQAVERKATDAEKALGYETVSMILDKSDFAGDSSTAGGVTISGIKVTQTINGKEHDVTSAYKTVVTAGTDAQYKTFNSGLFNDQLSGSITVNNFNALDNFGGQGLTITSNEITTNIADITYEIEADKKNKFTGTVMNDVANSTKEDETFDLKSSMTYMEDDVTKGGDTINFTGDFGDDTVTLNKGETINLNFGDNATYAYEIAGKDLKITANDYYYAEFTVGTDATYDTVTYKAGEKYRLDLVKVGKSSNEAALPSGSYAWGYAAREATAAEQAAGYTGKIYLYADLADVNDGNIGGLGAGNAAITFHHVTTAGDNVVTKTAIYGGETVANVATLATKNDTLYNAQAIGTVILKDYAAKDTGATIYVNDATHTNPAFAATFNKGLNDVVKGKVTGTSANDVVNVAEYVSADGVKGLTINTGSGNDNITGTSFNDTVTVKSLEGQTATVNMAGGTNKVTLGKGDDVYTGTGYASSTVNAGVGDNTITLGSVGTNKVTAKNGDNTVAVTAGSNTITLGNADKKTALGAVVGFNTIGLNGGQNKVTSGKGVDKYTIDGGNNVINSGAGEDTFTYTGAGYNTIKTGAGDKTFTGIAGTNNITTGKGDDIFVVNSGKNIIKSNAGDDTFRFEANSTTTPGDYTIVDGGAGNDIYDVSGLGNTDYVTITDKAGDNTIVLGDKLNIFFDVTNVKTDKAGVVKSYKIGNEMLFTQNAATYTANQGVDVTFKGGKNGATNFEAQIGASTYNVNLDEVASAVAGWLSTNTDYKSAYDALNNATGDKLAELIDCYTLNAAQNYVDPSALA